MMIQYDPLIRAPIPMRVDDSGQTNLAHQSESKSESKLKTQKRGLGLVVTGDAMQDMWMHKAGSSRAWHLSETAHGFRFGWWRVRFLLKRGDFAGLERPAKEKAKEKEGGARHEQFLTRQPCTGALPCESGRWHALMLRSTPKPVSLLLTGINRLNTTRLNTLSSPNLVMGASVHVTVTLPHSVTTCCTDVSPSARMHHLHRFHH